MAEPAKKSIAVFFAALTLFFVGIGSVVLLANDKRNLNALLVQLGFDPLKTTVKQLPDVQEPGKPVAKVIVIPDKLMDRSETIPPVPFKRTIIRSPQDICSALQAQGLIDRDWTVEDIGPEMWECSHEQLLSHDKDGVSPDGILYVSVRGLHHGRVSSVRMKVNFLRGSVSDSVLHHAVTAAADILVAIGWGADPEVLDHIRNLEEFEIKANGNRISLFKEQTDIPRYNFLIVSDTPSKEDKKTGRVHGKQWLESPVVRK